MRTIKTLDLEDAKKAVAAMEKRAKELKLNLCFCVVDANQNIIILERMDDSKIHTINLSRAKAVTAVSLKDSTGNAHKLIKDLSIESAYWAGGCETGFKGGICLYDDRHADCPLGAIGVSGGPQEKDEEIALVGLAATGFITK
ncbi:MAG: heme-binding protein [Actinobacteria bacterium]|nr:heme-binding protein [Actinomycetota bacterium]